MHDDVNDACQGFPSSLLKMHALCVAIGERATKHTYEIDPCIQLPELHHHPDPAAASACLSSVELSLPPPAPVPLATRPTTTNCNG